MNDYKPRPKAKRTNVGSTLLGIFVGLLLGLLIASAIAIYMMKTPFPWSKKARSNAADATAAAGRIAPEPEHPGGADKRVAEDKMARRSDKADKPHFDFYRILPGQNGPATAPLSAPAPAPRAEASKPESAKPESRPDAARPDISRPQPAGTEIARAAPAPSQTNFLLQAGAFQNPAEADNVKAKLALLGLESNIETVDLPDKGTWYRVRIGPYKSLTEVNHIRSQLAQNGIAVSVVRSNPAP